MVDQTQLLELRVNAPGNHANNHVTMHIWLVMITRLFKVGLPLIYVP